MIPDAAVNHYKQMQRLQALGVLAASRLWGEVRVSDLSGSWAAQIPLLVPVVAGLQADAASAGASYGSATLAAQGLYEAPEAFVNPEAFSGSASDGWTLEGLLYASVPYVKNLIGAGMEPRLALSKGGTHLTGMVRTQVADAGRAAAGVDVAARPNVGYVRMLNPPSCSRCSILAGRFYRWNAGFQRHKNCDCIHVMSTQEAIEAGTTEGLVHDPYEYFKSLNESEQNRVYTKAGAQAIRDGGDISQVVNARRGMKPGGLTTTEGTSKRGNFRASGGRGQRLSPEGIYSQNLPRERTLELLESNGYILPGGQNPTGGIVGQREGFGALGRGGTRVGAREAVLEARRTGVRDPRVRATMTEGERRVFDAQTRWDSMLTGVNPFNSKLPLTPEIAARIERDYRKNVLGY